MMETGKGNHSGERKDPRNEMKNVLVMSCLLVALLLVASCRPAGGELPEGKELVRWTGTKLDGTAVTRQLEEPKYGGVHTIAIGGSPPQFDDMRGIKSGFGILNWISNPTHETLVTRDWQRGPLGTNEWDPQNQAPVFEVMAGLVAESWELVEADTLALHIRKGIHWQDKPPLNGRELTPEDVLFSLKRNWTIGYPSVGYQFLADMENLDNSLYISPTDRWTIYVKSKPAMSGAQADPIFSGMTHIMAPEVFDGKFERVLTATDWGKIIGTGPFTLENYEADVSVTYQRNPNYWRADPFFPKNQLPYVDTLKFLIIPDLSTRLSALRTGKVDNVLGLNWETYDEVLKTSPKIKWAWSTGRGAAVHMRNDTEPFSDIRVRQALMLAVDQREILNEYYKGNAELFAYPVAPLPELAHLYLPLEKMPRSVQELYEYHPDKAQQLLAEAGYPQGFKTTVITDSDLERLDLLAIVKDYWAKIGVDLEIDVKEGGAFTGARLGRTYSQMIMYENAGDNPYALAGLKAKAGRNYSIVSDEEVENAYWFIQENYFDKEALGKLFRESTATRPGFLAYVNEQAYSVVLPTSYSYVGWQPYLKGYGGVVMATRFGDYTYIPYIWIDQELKKAMGY